MKKFWKFFLPYILSLFFSVFWFTGGKENLNRWELPSARLLNSLAGRNEIIDRAIIFFNDFQGEAIFVIIALGAYLLIASRFIKGRNQWKKICIFALFILCAWRVTDRFSNRLENVFERRSPSYYLNDSLVNLEDMYPEEKIKVYASTSFPSNHGNVFFMLFFLCLYRWGWKASGLGVLAIILSTPRMFTGAHWISDTLLGSALLSWLMTAIFMTPLILGHYLRFEEWASQKISYFISSLVHRFPLK